MLTTPPRTLEQRPTVTGEEICTKNIPIPSDGSELATKAVTHGVAFTREIGAKVTVLIVTEPFQIISLAPETVKVLTHSKIPVLGIWLTTLE
jgi:hypothetical protein